MTFVPRSFAAIIRNDNRSHGSWVEWTGGSITDPGRPIYNYTVSQKKTGSLLFLL